MSEVIDTVKETAKSFNELVNTLMMIREHFTTSLPSFTKPYMIESPLFIQKKIFDETDLLNDIISSIYDLYTGYIILAVRLDAYVEGGRRVRDVLGTVSTSIIPTTVKGTGGATESYIEVQDVIDNFTSLSIATEASSSKYNIGSDDSRRLISGRLIELSTHTVPPQGSDMKPQEVKIPLYIRLNTRVFPDSITEDIITANLNPSIRQRWLQYRAGEISFFKDFLMQLDLAEKRSRALRRDKSGTLYDLLYQRHKGLLKRILKLVGATSRAQNIFNSIFIMDRDDLRKAANSAGINFDRYSDRQQFFNRNYCMFVISVDNRSSIVDFYVDSIKQKGTYTYNQLKRLSRKDGFDIIEVIKALQQQQVNMRVI